jgi:hypothetical protein
VKLIIDTAEQLELTDALTLEGVTGEQHTAATAALEVA